MLLLLFFFRINKEFAGKPNLPNIHDDAHDDDDDYHYHCYCCSNERNNLPIEIVENIFEQTNKQLLKFLLCLVARCLLLGRRQYRCFGIGCSQAQPARAHRSQTETKLKEKKKTKNVNEMVLFIDLDQPNQ